MTSLGLAGPATADEVTEVEPREDVRYYDLADGVQESLPGRGLPEHRNGDLRRFVVRHGERRIRVAMRFRELDRREPVLMLQGRFRFPGDGQLDYAEAVVTATEANRAGRAKLSSTTARDTACTVRHRIRYATDRATLSFPTRCLSSPRWIRFNAWVLTMDHRKDPTYLYGDHVFPVLGSGGDVERFTRRIRRP